MWQNCSPFGEGLHQVCVSGTIHSHQGLKNDLLGPSPTRGGGGGLEYHRIHTGD